MSLLRKNAKDKLLAKSKNTSPIRVLYKKEGQLAEVKIIDNVFRLKKAIVTKDLSIIPYETLYIICNNKNLAENMEPNIVLNFSSIYGDLILVDIDKKNREFKGLTQEDIIWYSKDLNRKSFNSMKNSVEQVVNSILKNGDSNNG